jgi:DNA (cytosine-5)-methyltransferase 1
LLDLFCGAGGCAVGYARAGFDVVGVDHVFQPRYPFEFVQADALEFLEEHGCGEAFDAVHASPPCQGYSRMRHLPWLKGRKYPMLIRVTLGRLEETGLPFIVENVEDAACEMKSLSTVMLCGTMFGLKVYRHRLFRSNRLFWQPPHPRHKVVIGKGRMLNDRASISAEGWCSLPSKASGTPLNGLRPTADRHPVAGHFGQVELARQAMGIDWMKRDELAQTVPPAYTEYLGRQLMDRLAD